jgi:deoxyribodipyrimidine photo-lyase
MNQKFPTDYNTILQKIDLVDPVQYGKNRNYIDGAVTCLSPYISRGVISTRQVLKSVLEKGYKFSQIESFLKELCWRDYFQRVGQCKDLNTEIRHKQEPVLNDEIPFQILSATTGIHGIDNAINQLYQTGYMHNHCRMYTASLVCNIARSHWHQPAKWMYYHLLDGDWASNACSWQWVAGSNSNKKYYASQENINRHTYSNQANTFLDKSYEDIRQLETPAPLLVTQKFIYELNFPKASNVNIESRLPTFIYNYYNLDPVWHKDEPGNRILLIDTHFYEQYPVSNKCMDFMLALSKNIRGIQVFIGSFESFIENYKVENIYYKEHPLNLGFRGTEESRDWITDSVTGYYPSFFSYWKKVEKIIYNL